jgi:hypothetical protein
MLYSCDPNVDQWRFVVNIVKSGSCKREKHLDLMSVGQYIILGTDTKQSFPLGINMI